MKNIQFKIWPEVVSYLPAIIPLPKIPEGKDNSVSIDFSNTITVTSSACCLLLIRLLKLIANDKKRNWDTNSNVNKELNEKLNQLGLFEELNSFMPMQNLFGKAVNQTKLMSL